MKIRYGRLTSCKRKPDSEEFFEQYQAQHDCYMLCMDIIEEVYCTLQEELGLTGGRNPNTFRPRRQLPSRTNELAEKLKKSSRPSSKKNRSPNESKRAFDLLGVNDFHSLNYAYTLEDQRLGKAEIGMTKTRSSSRIGYGIFLKASIPWHATENDRVWWRVILWFWYHHAISCAIWKRKNRELAR